LEQIRSQAPNHVAAFGIDCFSVNREQKTLAQVKSLFQSMLTVRKYYKDKNGVRRPCKTMMVRGQARLPVIPQIKQITQKVRGKHISGNLVWEFQPVPDAKCCKKKRCLAQFTHKDDARVLAVRAIFERNNVSSDQRKMLVREAWLSTLQVSTGDDFTTPVCMTAACKIIGCSRQWLSLKQPTRTTRTKGEANSARAHKQADVVAWLHALKERLDVMPDQSWRMTHEPSKRRVYEKYKEDGNDCSPTLFYDTWRLNFPEIRCRKHCRFAKCDFCIERRAILQDQTRLADHPLAKERLTLHLTWAHSRERGLYHKKQAEALSNPKDVMSISLDGTDQMINGFPHFWEAGKSSSKGKRLNVHTQIGLVHGHKPMIFVAYEDVAGDPNWTIECVYRMIRRQEMTSEKLPSVLYVQLDNCFRENKNTYVLAWFAWLVERRVFKQVLTVIFRSFLISPSLPCFSF
jgi:hypothetical protein